MFGPRGVIEHLLQVRNWTWSKSWLNQCQTAQACIQMLLTDPETSSVHAGEQTHFGSLVDEVLNQRSRLGNSTLKANPKVFLIDIVSQTRVQHDRDPALVFGSELAHG